ncbi:MAG: hypothetical protein M5U09_19345 [Gammaproteobacteria bacterium]|nr:hypothetical protein [Gammaproteobacteria bacterium]
MACHTANMPFMALELGYPTSIEAVKLVEAKPGVARSSRSCGTSSATVP